MKPSLPLSTIDMALWDMRAKNATGGPSILSSAGAQRTVGLYATEGGWLHLETPTLVANALDAKDLGLGGFKMKVGRPMVEDVKRVAAVAKP